MRWSLFQIEMKTHEYLNKMLKNSESGTFLQSGCEVAQCGSALMHLHEKLSFFLMSSHSYFFDTKNKVEDNIKGGGINPIINEWEENTGKHFQLDWWLG